MKAARLNPESVRHEGRTLYPSSFIAELIMAWMLAGLLGHLGTFTLTSGVVTALFMWFGFIATTIAVNERYQGYGWGLTFINGGHWLGVAILMGAILGVWGIVEVRTAASPTRYLPPRFQPRPRVAEQFVPVSVDGDRILDLMKPRVGCSIVVSTDSTMPPPAAAQNRRPHRRPDGWSSGTAPRG